ncbi:NAD(P)-binding protein [uncultured Mailhella sp.]|uniref:protoporphyrinogen/coproporphyrinogen oxidase n=1 Tax=uncultured Mailhella sp. TaxID=1981031 RepID=UPI00263687A2|nr:NAD(P)-binding protein [uncultured Mailhella sp.]
MIYDFIILGAGVTGITLLKAMRRKGVERVMALEAEAEPGGLCRSFRVGGHIVDIGGHFFQTKFPEVEDFLFSSFPREKMYRIDPRISKIRIEGMDVDYPLESNLWQLPVDKQIDYLLSVIRNGESLGRPEPVNYEEWIRWKLGDRICDGYLIPYNIKLWGIQPREMDVDWLYKIPRIEVKEVLRYSLERHQDVEKYPCHNRPYYPLSGGYGKVMEVLAREELPNILLNTPVKSLSYDKAAREWLVNGEYKTRNVITTIPWPSLYRYLGSPEEIRGKMEFIRYNKVVISLFETAENSNNYHWRYRPEMEQQHHRELFISNFVKDSKKYGVFTETNADRFDASRLTFPGKNLFNYTTPAAYPLPLLGRTKAITSILEHYKEKHLFGIGRWGEHQHHNHDVCIKHALDFVAKL